VLARCKIFRRARSRPVSPRACNAKPFSAPEHHLCKREEIFGPVLAIKTYGSLDEAIEYVNGHPRPLALYFFGCRQRQAGRGAAADRLGRRDRPENLPFGGGRAVRHRHFIMANSVSRPSRTAEAFFCKAA